MIEDHQLREHPASTIRRLKAAGKWREAERLLRKTKQQCRRRFAKAGGPLTAKRQLEIAKVGWDAVQDRWPPPPGTAPLPSLVAYLRTTRGARRCGSANELPSLSFPAEQRFNDIGETDNLVGEIIWVYHRLDDANVDPLQCPSRGAWALLGQARKDRQRFYEKTYIPAVRENSRRQASIDVGDYEPSRVEKRAVEELREMLREAVDESQLIHCPNCGHGFTEAQQEFDAKPWL